MKQISALLILVSIFLVSFVNASILGDFDGDGYVQANDMAIMKNLVVGLPAVCTDLNGNSTECSNFDLFNDGKFTIADFMILQDVFKNEIIIEVNNTVQVMVNLTGDCDSDGYVQANDIIQCKNLASGLQASCQNINGTSIDPITVFDFYPDNKITSTDCEVIKEVILNETSIPEWDLINITDCQPSNTLTAQWTEKNNLLEPFNVTLDCTYVAPYVAPVQSSSSGGSSGSSRKHATIVTTVPVVTKPVIEPIVETIQEVQSAPEITSAATVETRNGNLYILAGITIFLGLIASFSIWKKYF